MVKDKGKDKKDKKPKVNPELEGFELEINEFGEIISNYDVDKINEFLNKHVDDKKLKGDANDEEPLEEEKEKEEQEEKEKQEDKEKEEEE